MNDRETPGAVLIRLGLGSSQEAKDDTWADDLAGIDVRTLCPVLFRMRGEGWLTLCH